MVVSGEIAGSNSSVTISVSTPLVGLRSPVQDNGDGGASLSNLLVQAARLSSSNVGLLVLMQSSTRLLTCSVPQISNNGVVPQLRVTAPGGVMAPNGGVVINVGVGASLELTVLASEQHGPNPDATRPGRLHQRL